MPDDGRPGEKSLEHDAHPSLPDAARPPRSWFPAKTYGWGWGVPCTWEGWLVLATFIGLTVAVVRICPPGRNLPGFLAGVYGLALVLILVCWWTGEPPKWRCGRKPPR
ncbi:MAG: hypothetical protein ACKOTB_19495 [Planctomycetia bacterium]